MQGDQFRATPGTKADRAPLKTHEFGWDPLERLRLAAHGVSAVKLPRVPRFPRRVALAIGVAAVATGALAGAGALVSGGGSPSATSELERSLDAREASLKQREDRLAELERRRVASEAEIRDGEKRIADLERRRSDLQRQVAELTAPVAPAGDDSDVAPSDSPDRSAALNDPTPPDETVSGDTEISASSRRGEDERPSTAAVEEASAQPTETRAEETVQQSGPVRVFIHVRSADPVARERAEAVAAELRRRGVAVAQIRGVVRPVRRDAVRYYYDADRGAVTALQDAVKLASPISAESPQPQDFRGFRAPPKRGTLELWLS